MKTMTATAILALAAALLAAPVLAQAEGGERARGPQLPAFAEIDTDGDGAFTLADWRSFVTTRTETRRAERTEARVNRLFEAADADGDGAITRAELAAGFQALDEARRTQAEERRGERSERGPRGAHMRGWHHGGRHDGRMGMRGHPGMGRMMAMDADERIVRGFQRLDRDGDGRVTEAEYTRMTERMQARMDRHRRPAPADNAPATAPGND